MNNSKQNIQNEFKNFKVKKGNVIVTNHFKEKLHENRGLTPNIMNDITAYIRGAFRRLEIHNVMIQMFKGQKRIVVNKRGLYFIVAYNSFIERSKIVLISILSNKMDLRGTVKKESRKKSVRRNNDYTRVSYDLTERGIHE